MNASNNSKPPAPLQSSVALTSTATQLTPLDAVIGAALPIVTVMGNVSVRNPARDFASHRAVDLVAYLAFHRDGADAERLRSWMWPPDDPPSDRAFANVLSRARLGLGVDDEGRPWLSRAGSDHVYRLDPRVRTDVDVFEDRVERADNTADRGEQLAMLLDALALVRGVPFTGGGANSFGWADHIARAQVLFLVDETAHRCADLALELGLTDSARSAVFIGLRTIAGCEQCYERRFRLAAAERNLTGLRSSMADLEAVLAADFGEPSGAHLVSRHLREQWSELVSALTTR